MRQSTILRLLPLLLFTAVTAGCSTTSIPGWNAGDPSADRARTIVERSAAAHGGVWPTYFVERIREPVSAFAHRWRLVGLDVDRGLSREDLVPGALSTAALTPAGSTASGTAGATATAAR